MDKGSLLTAFDVKIFLIVSMKGDFELVAVILSKNVDLFGIFFDFVVFVATS
jgi:hypothetical protein